MNVGVVSSIRNVQGILMDGAAKCREAAERLPPGRERELLMKRVQQAEKTAQISDWLNPGPAPSLGGLLKIS